MKPFIKLVAILTLICLFWTAMLAGVDAITRERIADAGRQKEIAAVRVVLPPGVPEPVAQANGTATNYVARDVDGRLVAVAAKGFSANGYGGIIALMVGFTADGRVNNFQVLAANETPGLGSKIASDKFKAGICGRPAGTRWAVRKDGGEVDAITAATISSRAALEAIRDAAAQFKAVSENPPEGVTAAR